MLTAGTLDSYLADLDQRVEKMFADLVKSLAEKENVIVDAEIIYLKECL